MRCLDGGLNMFKLSEKVRLIFALLGVSSILVSMYLIPFIKTENKFWEILLFILGILLIGIALLNPPKKLNFENSVSEKDRIIVLWWLF